MHLRVLRMLKDQISIGLDEEAMKDKIGHDWKNQESYYADDGSVLDW
jgi:galactonate dehydratase